MNETLYAEHVRARQRKAEEALAATGFDATVVSSGTPLRYFADDQDAPFRPTPHFAHWTPLDGPHHLLLVRPGRKPFLVRVAPEDYWVEQAPLGDPFWLGEFDFREVRKAEEAWALVRTEGSVAYVGDAPEKAIATGIAKEAANPEGLVARLDWDRSFKTPYEVACVEGANEIAARAHAAAREAFEAGDSEFEIHRAYLAAVGAVDKDLPYEGIVALDRNAATLHYAGKRTTRDGRVLLLDSGAKRLGYASDITRTWTRGGCPSAFRDLVRALDGLQRSLCAAVKPGVPFPDLHHRAHAAIADALRSLGILRVGGEEAVEKGLTRAFFPHGLGHFLGLQVHDVAGHQKEPAGGKIAPPSRYPHLRTTRTIEEGQVFTIEPGIYFIEMLLRDHRGGPTSSLVDWRLVDALVPCGGARIEDDVLVTADGHRNLTRPHV